MTTRARRLVGLAAALLFAGGATPVARLDVQVDQLRSAKGMVRLCLTADPHNFPNCVDDARALTRSVPAGVHALSLTGLAPGSYALAVFHDENSNDKLDTLVGIPREGFGFSRNPPLGFGPPRFGAAEFGLTTGAQLQQIRMRYIL